MALSFREKEEALRLWLTGLTHAQIGEIIGKTRHEVRNYIKLTPEYKKSKRPGAARLAQVQASTPPSLVDLLKRPKTREELMEACDISDRVLDAMLEDLKDNGYLIDTSGDKLCLAKVTPQAEPQEIDVKWKGNRQIRFGVVSDNHINSKYTQITLLHEAYDRFQREGIKHVYNAGDIDEGEQMRKGHQYECYHQGADDHVDEIVRVYPVREKITTHFITGNHDASFIKLSGIDIGKQIANQRPDMNYLGQDDVIVNLTPHCRLEVMHPGGGSAYAWSYRPQKIVESLEGGTKPNVLLIGHYHKAEYLFYRNVHILQAGTTQAQTPWMRSKALHASMGCWIVDLDVTDEGQVDACRSTFFPCYQPIVDDYKNWKE